MATMGGKEIITLYAERRSGVINKTAYKLDLGDKLVVDEVRFVDGRKVIILRVMRRKK